MLDHRDVPDVRWELHTRGTTARLYHQLGFETVDETVMQRRRPG